ncbi:carbohydrate-binding domain-containing protein [Fusibacter sp. JL298sf-3]
MKKWLGLIVSVLLILAGCTTTEGVVVEEIQVDMPLESEQIEANTAEETTVDAVTLQLSGNGIEGTPKGVTVGTGTATITESGSYRLTGAWTDGQIVVDADSDSEVSLVLDQVTIEHSESAAIYVAQAEKVTIVLASGTENILKTTGAFVNSDEITIDGVVFSRDDLVLTGEGTLYIESAEGHGVVSKDTLAIESGSYTVDAAGHGFEANDAISVQGGTFDVTAGKDGFHSENETDQDLGNIVIEAGSLTISSGSDGMHAGGSLTIYDGEVVVNQSVEGLEGKTVSILGGVIDITASDDGINSVNGVETAVTGASQSQLKGGFETSDGSAVLISGGTIAVDAEGDGIDSNGDLSISGGTILVAGPISDRDGALDYNGNANISGGVVIAAGASGMAQNFSSATQGSALVILSGSQTGTIRLLDDSGTVITAFSPNKAYRSVVVSAPELAVGETYTIEAGGETQTFTLTDTLYGAGGMRGGGMGQPPRRP